MNEIEQLLAREQIRNQLSVYCRGIDRRDWDMVRACFADEHNHKHPPFEGTLDEFIGFASTVLKTVAVSHHSIANVIVELAEDGLSASSQCNFTALHLIEAGQGGALSFDTGDGDTDWLVGGSYADEWIYRDGQWLICGRQAAHHWERIEPATKKLTT